MMSRAYKIVEKIAKALSSIKVFVISTSAMSVFLVYDTIFAKGYYPARDYILGFLGFAIFLNILSCTFSRLIYKVKSSVSFHLIHWGILLTIAGFILSSIYSFEGEMFIHKGEESNLVISEDTIYKIPFRIRLESFKIEYYSNPLAEIYNPISKEAKPAVPGAEISSGESVCRVEKFIPDFVLNEKNEAMSRTPFFNNPAAKISCKSRNKKEDSYWIFSNSSGHSDEKQHILLRVKNSDIKNFISSFKILYRGKKIDARVSVNSPYSFEGYKIYQTSYDSSAGEASVLTIKKDKWLWLVFIGFLILSAGAIIWLF